jgi:ankyrin repeat protein
LLAAGADKHRADDGGDTPLHTACALGDAEAVGLLLRPPCADVNQVREAGWRRRRWVRFCEEKRVLRGNRRVDALTSHRFLSLITLLPPPPSFFALSLSSLLNSRTAPASPLCTWRHAPGAPTSPPRCCGKELM